MKQRPIIFSTEMVRDILEGRKTQTRRIVKFNAVDTQYLEGSEIAIEPRDVAERFQLFKNDPMFDGDEKIADRWSYQWNIKCPYGQPGDILYVRESCMWVMQEHASDLLEGSRNHTQWEYKASAFDEWVKYAKEKYNYKWTPSIHMPKAAARIWLQITEVRAERLQEISEKDSTAEGIENIMRAFDDLAPTYRNYTHNDKNDPWAVCADNAQQSFQTLWQSINGPDSWNKNPWVWVINFKRIDNPNEAA